MGEDEGCAGPGGPLLNGLLPGASLVMRSLNEDQWVKAEERVSEIIACIQPNQLSEERRNAVADYVQQLIMKCIPCEVYTFGSVPLKTYLPDGDIDLTTFSHDQNSKDTWASQVRDMLESEEKNENAIFHVKEVRYIQAEVKIIKCLVGNIVVDISFNQIGGLCTLCFLDEVDTLINQNHLFKRSIILIKAWCYYESRILGAHYGLISTYALETLVLYIFHVFNNSFNGPLEVLYRFLVFFSNFDWDNFCVSLWGPVPISSLPDVTAKPPRKDSGELLLSKGFLETCSMVYAVLPGGQENNGQPFVSKHFNVIDPLRVNNNLGRSVSKGNFFRIRSAFAFGAKRLAELLDCPKDDLIDQVNEFFMNTWKRHGSGHRPDAPGIDSWPLRLSAPDRSHEFGSSDINDNSSNTNNSKNTNNGSSSKKEKEGSHGHTNAKNLSGTVPLTSGFRNQPRVSHQIERGNTQGRLLFARTHSSPELTDISSQVQRNRRTENAETRQKIVGIESLPSHSTHLSVEDAFVRPNQKSSDTSAKSSSIVSNSYQHDSGFDGLSDEPSAFSGSQQTMNQEEKDIVNMMGSVSLQSFNGQHHAPFNLTSDHLPYSIPPAFLASMGYAQRNFPGFVPANIPFMDSSLSQMQFQHGLVSSQLTHYFPGIGLNNNPSEDSNSVEADSDFWKEQDAGPSSGHALENGNLGTFQSVDNKPSAPSSMRGLKYVPPPFRICQSTSGARVQQKHTREKLGTVRENFKNHIDEVYGEEKLVSSRLSSASHSNSLRSQTSSESSWDESPVKLTSKSIDKRGKKIISTDVGKIRSEQISDLQGLNRKHHNLPDFDVPQTSGSDSMIPFAPILINPGSRQRINDNSGMIAFYPTGPPIPFLTMLPMYNSDASSGHFGGDETLDNSDSGMSFNPKGHDFSGDSSTSEFLRRTSASEISEEQKSDILNSDFASHLQNLQFGRICLNSNQQGSLLYPSPAMVPPVYVQGQIPYNNPNRPLSINTDHFSQPVPSYGHRVVPVAPAQPVTTRHPNIYHDVPKFRGGTGTYLPNPKAPPLRDHHSSSSRRGNYNQDRNDRESNPKPRGVSRNQSRSQSDNKINSRTEGQSERLWNSHRRNTTIPNGPLRSVSSQNVSSSGTMIPNGVSNRTSAMMYPFDQNGGSSSEQPLPPRHQRRAW